MADRAANDSAGSGATQCADARDFFRVVNGAEQPKSPAKSGTVITLTTVYLIIRSFNISIARSITPARRQAAEPYLKESHPRRPACRNRLR